MVLTPDFTMVSVPVGGLNLIVVPVGAAVKLVGPNREPDVLPKGLEAVLVVPKSPPLLVLVPKFPKPAGLFCAKALFCDEKRLPPVLVVPKRLFEVPVDVPKPKPVLVEEVAGWLKVVEPKSPPGFVCVLPKRLPVLLAEPKADVPKAPPLVVPKPAFCPKVEVVPKPVLPPNGVPKDLLNIFRIDQVFVPDRRWRARLP